jgi:hypothetical protein
MGLRENELGLRREQFVETKRQNTLTAEDALRNDQIALIKANTANINANKPTFEEIGGVTYRISADGQEMSPVNPLGSTIHEQVIKAEGTDISDLAAPAYGRLTEEHKRTGFLDKRLSEDVTSANAMGAWRDFTLEMAMMDDYESQVLDNPNAKLRTAQKFVEAGDRRKDNANLSAAELTFPTREEANKIRTVRDTTDQWINDQFGQVRLFAKNIKEPEVKAQLEEMYRNIPGYNPDAPVQSQEVKNDMHMTAKVLYRQLKLKTEDVARDELFGNEVGGMKWLKGIAEGEPDDVFTYDDHVDLGTGQTIRTPSQAAIGFGIDRQQKQAENNVFGLSIYDDENFEFNYSH